MSSERKLDNWIDAYVRYTDNSEPPMLFRKWCAISAIASALQRKCWLDWGIAMTLYPNMYIILVGPPAARKGTAMGPAESLVRQLAVPLSASATTKEALTRSLKEAEAVVQLRNGESYVHSSLTVIAKELTVFVGQANYNFLSVLTDWFDCANRWEYKTKTAGTDDITNVWVNLIGATTPDLIRTSLPQDAVGGGFTSRVIFVYEDGKGKLVPFPYPTQEEKQLEALLAVDLEQISHLSGPFTVTQAFRRMWEAYYLQSANEELFPAAAERHFLGYTDRRAVHALKLSMIMCAARTSDMRVDDCDLEAALNLLKVTERKMPKTFFGMGKGKDAAVYASMIRVLQEKKAMSVLDLVSMHRTEAVQSELLATVCSIVANKLAKFEENKTRIVYLEGKVNGL